MFRYLVAKLTGGELVVLRDFQDDTYKTIAYKNPFNNNLKAHVYWFTRVGNVQLLPTGECTGFGGKPSYIEEWKKG